MAASSEKKITLKSCDGQTFEVEHAIASESQMIKEMIEGCADNEIPIPIVKGTILEKVIDYCKKHVEASDDDLMKWDEDFVKVDQATLYGLIKAAHYLDIKSLYDLTCQTVANMIKNKTSEEIRKTFNIVNDLSPEEEEEVRRENAWTFD